jgi:hypothetical protein
MMTPRQVADDLNRIGYAVSVRQLRDWRGKGLLPALATHGRGRGKGRLAYWEDPRIVQRAITVYELLGERERFPDSHYLEIWFAGYEVKMEKVRKAWLSSLARTQSEWLKGASSTEECEDALGDLSHRLAKGSPGETWAKDSGLDWKRLEPLLLEVLNACLNPHLDIEIAVDEQVADTARAVVYRQGRHPEGPELVTESELEKWLYFIHTNLSIGAMRRLISAATTDELSVAHRRWGTALDVARLLSTKANCGEISADLRKMGIQFAVHFGGLCLFGLLSLGRNGLGPLVDARLNEAEQMIRTNVIPPSGDRSVRRLAAGLSVQRTRFD